MRRPPPQILRVDRLTATAVRVLVEVGDLLRALDDVDAANDALDLAIRLNDWRIDHGARVRAALPSSVFLPEVAR